MWCYVFAIKFKYYESKKVRHIAIPLHYFNDNHICISIMITAITFCILAISTIIIQVIKDRKDYYNHHNKRGTSRP